MLKKITPRHREVMRRLIVGETPAEIADGLGMNVVTVRNYLKDPLFGSELHLMEQKVNDKLLNSPERLDALKIIQEAAGISAQLCANTVRDPEQDITLRIKSAWDILDRNPETAKTNKQYRASMDLTELIVEAAKRRSEGSEDYIEAEAVR